MNGVQGGWQWLPMALHSGISLEVTGEKLLDEAMISQSVCASVGFDEAGSTHEAKACYRVRCLV